MNTEQKKESVTRALRMPAELSDKLNKVVKRERRNFNQQTQIFIEDGLAAYEAKQAKIKEIEAKLEEEKVA